MASDDSLHATLAQFDSYSQQFMSAVCPDWDASKRMLNLEYCAFLYGATLAIVADGGREDVNSARLLRGYLSYFMDSQFSVGWLLNCEDQLSRSPRLQTVQAAGRNTAQAVLAASRGQANLNHPQNFQLLVETFAEVRTLMDDRAASGERLFATNDRFCDSLAGV